MRHGLDIPDLIQSGRGLNASIKRAYRLGLFTMIRKNKRTILKFNDLPPLFRVDYSVRDIIALNHFRVEAFTVAHVGNYELQERLKKLAADIWKKHEETDAMQEFLKKSKPILDGYKWNDKVPPDGWLKTNLQTAVNTSHSAAKFIRATDPSLAGIYGFIILLTTGDDKVRPAHAKLNRTVARINTPAGDLIIVPLDWNCRCRNDYLTADEVNQEDIYEYTPERLKELEENIGKDFRRNPGKDNSIWGKWLESGLKEINLNEVTERMLEFARSDMKLTGFEIPEDFIEKFNRAVKTGKLSLIKDYDDNLLLSLTDKDLRPVVEKITGEPDEVWGRTSKTNRGREVEIHYIKFTSTGIVVIRVKNGATEKIVLSSIDEIDKVRKGFLMHKNFN